MENRILKAVGVNGKIITDVIPAVELIIGKQNEVPELGPEQGRNRFNYVFKNFISIFTTEEHPLTLFLDDLQWADLASLTLIKMIITDPDNNYLLLIGAYRDNEVNSLHPFIGTIEDLKKEIIVINSIIIAPLSISNVNQLLVNFLRCEENKSLKVAEIILYNYGPIKIIFNEILSPGTPGSICFNDGFIVIILPCGNKFL